MKHLLFALSAYALCTAALAGDVTLTNTFSPNQPARASEVNQNFTDVKTAVDDNSSRITTLEGVVPGKQDRVTGTCGAEESIKSINNDGTVICEADSDSGGTVTSVSEGGGISVTGTASDPVVSQASGSVAFTGNALRVKTDSKVGCEVDPENHLARVKSTINPCHLQAPVNFPDGAMLTDMSCTFTTSVNTTMSWTLSHATLSSDSIATILQVSSSVMGVTTRQSREDLVVSSADAALITNSSRVYFVSVQVNHANTPNEETLVISGCTINYVF